MNMKKTAIVSAAAALLLLAGVGLAQPPGQKASRNELNRSGRDYGRNRTRPLSSS
jgi:hypothetical protein